MGRLFWKFFFFIWLAQLTTVVGVSTTFWLKNHELFSPIFEHGEGRAPPPEGGAFPAAAPSSPQVIRRHGPGHHFPLEPIIAGLFASLGFAALLARYFSKPIHSLRSAFESVSVGNLDVHLGTVMGKRRDELADLGHDFDRMVRQLRALMDGQRRLLHDVSHELRSPLARLQAAIGLARQQPEKLENSLDRIEREGMRMDKLVGELLTLSRLEAGVIASTKEELNIDDLVNDIVKDARFEAEARGITVDMIGNCAAMIRGDIELLHWAIENVVRNAVKHTPDGTQVSVDGRLDVKKGSLLLSVLDEGPGVPASELSAIFEPFFRGRRTKLSDGHGLGLAIARRVVETYGGTIHAANRPNGGLRIDIVLPAHGVPSP